MVSRERVDRVVRAFVLLDQSTLRITDPRVQRLTAAFQAARDQLTAEEQRAYGHALRDYWSARRGERWR